MRAARKMTLASVQKESRRAAALTPALDDQVADLFGAERVEGDDLAFHTRVYPIYTEKLLESRISF